VQIDNLPDRIIYKRCVYYLQITRSPRPNTGELSWSLTYSKAGGEYIINVNQINFDQAVAVTFDKLKRMQKEKQENA
jgi:hypothetical protein